MIYPVDRAIHRLNNWGLDLPPSVKNSSIVDNNGSCVFGKITERLGFEMFSFLSHYAKFQDIIIRSFLDTTAMAQFI